MHLQKVEGKTVGEIIEIKSEMWDIEKNVGREMYCYCEERESLERVVDCKKVKEMSKTTAKKEWLVSEKSRDLIKITECINACIGKRADS